MTFHIGFILLGVPCAMVLLLWISHRLLLWMECKDWIYYRRKRPANSVTRSIFNGFEEFVHPEIQHVKEDQTQRAAIECDEHRAGR